MSDMIESNKIRVEDRRIINEFLEWCSEYGIVLSNIVEETKDYCFPRYAPITLQRNDLILRYFGVDKKKLEEERRALLKSCQEEQ